MFAVIFDRNKQYFVKTGSLIKVDLLNVVCGDFFYINKILFFDNNGDIKIGKPYVNNIRIVSKVISHEKEKKKTILKFKRRKNYKRKIGHRQKYTLLKIVSFEKI